MNIKNVFFGLFLISSIGASAQVTCRLKGTVFNRPNSTAIYLGTRNTDWRTGEFVRIPLADSSFSYVLTVDHPQEYVLVFEDEVRRGMWWPIEFMAEDSTVGFELHPMDDRALNVIEGGPLQRRFGFLTKKPCEKYPTDLMYARCDSLDKAGGYYSDAMKRWIVEIEKAKDVRVRDSLFKVRNSIDEYTPEAEALMRAIDSLNRLRVNWALGEIGESVDESGLAVLRDFVYRAVNYSDKAVDLSRCREVYAAKYREKYAGNPMADETDLLLGSTELKVGNRYVDFSSRDLQGDEKELSELIGGKVAVIDLWASWCGPCMRTSKSFVPVWEKYKDKGFTIVGVARERNDTRAMEEAIERMGLPWLNLVELDDNGKIWMKYGADNKAGRVVLVDSSGTIVAIDFDAAELEEHLQRLCGLEK